MSFLRYIYARIKLFTGALDAVLNLRYIKSVNLTAFSACPGRQF